MSQPNPADQTQDDRAGLRKKLDAALDSNRKLMVENTLFKAGLGHLNEAQTHALTITLPKGTEITPDALKGQATALGFPLEATPPPPPPADTNGNGTPPGQPNGQPDPNANANDTDGSMTPTYDQGTNWLTPAPGSAHPDPRVNASIEGLTQQEEAMIRAQRADAFGGTGGDDFDKALNGAKSKDEALAIIRNQGMKSGGLILGSDLE